MAIIKCPECGREISDKAKVCINCGCPIEANSKNGKVWIKIPNTNKIAVGFTMFLSSRRAVITDLCGRELWSGHHGENASFEVTGETKVFIDLGGFANKIVGIVKPHCKYTLVQDMGLHMLATFRLTEIDIFDSD